MSVEITESPEIEQAIVATNTDAMALKVTDAVTYEQAATIWRGFKDLEKCIKDYFSPMKKQADLAHKLICDREKEELAKLSPGLQYLNGEMTSWRIEEERKRREEEDRRREELRKREEEERLKLAIELEKEGRDKAEVEAVLETPAYIPPPVVKSEAPKVAGVAMAVTYKAKVVDFMALVRAVANGKAPQMCLQANEQFLNSMARSGKGTVTYPGIEITKDESMRGARK